MGKFYLVESESEHDTGTCGLFRDSVLYVTERRDKKGAKIDGSTITLKGGFWFSSPLSIEEIEAMFNAPLPDYKGGK